LLTRLDGVNYSVAISKITQLLPLVADLAPEEIRGAQLTMDDLVHLDSLSRKMKVNKVVRLLKDGKFVAIQLRGAFFFQGTSSKSFEEAVSLMKQEAHFIQIVRDSHFESYESFAKQYGVQKKNKTFLFSLYCKARASSPYVDEIAKKYLYSSSALSLIGKVSSGVARIAPAAGILVNFLKSWSEFKTIFGVARDALITEDERFNVWSQLITRLYVVSEMEGFDDFLASFEGKMICNRIVSLKKYVYRYVDFAASLGDCESLRTYVRGRFAFMSRISHLLSIQTNQPIVLELNGDAGVGKSHCISVLAKHFAALLGMEQRDVVYVRPNTAKYWTGYCGQPIVVYDDFNQDPAVDGLNELIHVASGVPYEVPCADIVDKGVFFSSDLIILTTNESISTMNCGKIKCKDALMRRITHTLRVNVAPKCAKLVGEKLQFRSGSNATRLYLGKTEFDVYGFAAWSEIIVREQFEDRKKNQEIEFEEEEWEIEEEEPEYLDIGSSRDFAPADTFEQDFLVDNLLHSDVADVIGYFGVSDNVIRTLELVETGFQKASSEQQKDNVLKSVCRHLGTHQFADLFYHESAICCDVELVSKFSPFCLDLFLQRPSKFVRVNELTYVIKSRKELDLLLSKI